LAKMLAIFWTFSCFYMVTALEFDGFKSFLMDLEDVSGDKEILLIGSGMGKGLGTESVSKTFAFNLPSFTVANCTPPSFPHEEYQGYVGKMTPSGLLLCGGTSSSGDISSCSLLSETGGWETVEEMEMDFSRYSASAVETESGWWITGPGASTTLWDGASWLNTTQQPELPDYTVGHCLVRLNSSHVLLTGGTLAWESGAPETTASYLYSQDSGFVRVNDMPTPRALHGCGVHQGEVVVAGGWGGGSQTSDIFSLETLTWQTGPRLSSGQGYARTADFISWNNRAFWVGEKWVWELTGAEKSSWKWETVAQMEADWS